MTVEKMKLRLARWASILVMFTGAAHAAGQQFENPEIGPKGYHVGSYGDGAYWVTDGLYNSMFVVSDEGVIVVDAPPSYAAKLPEAIRTVTDLPVKYFVYSHHHKDHTGGAAIFGEDVTLVSHELTAVELRRKNDPNRPIPGITFSDTYTLELGNQKLNLAYPGLQHSPGNIFIHLPEQKVLMLVDVLYPGLCPSRTLPSRPACRGSIERTSRPKTMISIIFRAVMSDGRGHVRILPRPTGISWISKPMRRLRCRTRFPRLHFMAVVFRSRIRILRSTPISTRRPKFARN